MEGSEVLALKWNNHQSIFYNIICGLRSKERYTDATLACDGKFFPVHKLVLSTCSEYFSDIFERTPCKNPVVVLKDIRCIDLCFLLDYMYMGEVNVRQNELSSLIKAAECLRVKGLAVPDEETPSQKSSSKATSSRRQQSEHHSPAVKRRRTDDQRSFNSDSGSPDQPLFRSRSGCDNSNSNANHRLETKIGVASLRHEESNVREKQISRHKDVVNQSERLNPVIKLEQEDNYDSIPNHQDIYEDSQYLSAADQNCGGISSRESRPDKGKLEVIEDDMDPNFSDILNEESLAAAFTPLAGGNLESWDGGQVLSSHAEILTGTSNSPHNSRQHQQKVPDAVIGLNGELMCPICGRCSSRRDNLDRHIRSHLGDKPFKCPFCPFRAQLKYNMKTHVERRHPQQSIINPNITFEQTTEIH